MIILNSVKDCKKWSKKQEDLALIPTMGALHDGHLELIKQTKKITNNILVSIFVNPSQFGANEDFDQYPRQLEIDLEKLKKLNITAAFTPSTKSMYPNGITDTTIIQPRELAKELCGKSRPNLFPGAATVVIKLLNCCNAKYLVLGKKDYQQKLILSQTIQDLMMDCEIISINTKRNSNNLALSSRNKYLSQTEKELACNIYKTLQKIKKTIENSSNINNICYQATMDLNNKNIHVEYLSIKTQKELTTPSSKDKNLVILIAAKIGNTRLIDNIEVQRP